MNQSIPPLENSSTERLPDSEGTQNLTQETAMKVILILAMDESRCIGKDGDLPWPKNAEDFKHFKESTLDHAIIMGRKTFDSIGKPLPKRRNIVLSRNPAPIEGTEIFDSIESCMAAFENVDADQVFVIGGAEIYRQFIEKWLADELWISHMPGTYEGDTYFPYFENRFEPFFEKRFDSFDFRKYRRINSRTPNSKWTTNR